jgi:hypothetical protein
MSFTETQEVDNSLAEYLSDEDLLKFFIYPEELSSEAVTESFNKSCSEFQTSDQETYEPPAKESLLGRDPSPSGLDSSVPEDHPADPTAEQPLEHMVQVFLENARTINGELVSESISGTKSDEEMISVSIDTTENIRH